MDKFLIIWASVLRVIPLPFGTTPLGAFGLFAGSQLSMGRALTVPLVALVVGDLVIGFYSWVVMLFVYAGFVLTPLIGRWLIRDRRHAGQIGIAVGANALVFYAVSNFGNWLAFYPKTVEGLVANYMAGLPFLGYAFVADLAYCAILFGGYEAVQRLRAARLAA